MRLSGPDAVHEATNAALSFATANKFGVDDRARLAIVVEELITNLYEHGGLTESDDFELELSANAGEARLVLTDSGTPSDPACAQQSSQIPARGGGSGLALIRAWATQLSYHSSVSGNRLELVLPFRA